MTAIESIITLFPTAKLFEDFSVSKNNANYVIGFWNTAALGPQPTQAELDAVTQVQVDAARLAKLRAKAIAAFQSQDASQNALIRAVVIELLNYINVTNAKHNSLLTWLGTQTTLINRNQLPGLQAAQATTLQARNAIQNRINAGEAD